MSEPTARGLRRRDFIATSLALGLAAPSLARSRRLTVSPLDAAAPPAQMLADDRRYVLRGAAVLSMDRQVGDFTRADIMVQGKKIVAVHPNIQAGETTAIDCSGRIIIPGFVDTHHHLFETALRSFLPNGLLFDDGHLDGALDYSGYVVDRLSPGYEPEDIYVSELFGSLSQLDAGVTTVHDTSQIHHSPSHSDAVVKALADSGRRAVMGYCGSKDPLSPFPADAARLKSRYFASTDQLLTMVVGGEIAAPDFDEAWRLARSLGLPVTSHVVGKPMGIALAGIAKKGWIGKDNLFFHMTSVDDETWRTVAASGAGISLATPIEMVMRHGTPPIMKVLSLGLEPSLSSDVECTMTADSFTQMRTLFALQRMQANQMVIDGKTDLPRLLTAHDVLRFATLRGAEDLWLGGKVGSLTPGKEADLVILDAQAIDVVPVNNVAGAVVTLMDRSNVETVIVAGAVKKWQGKLLGQDVAGLRARLIASRDRIFLKARLSPNLLGA